MSIVAGTNQQLLHMLGITQKHVIEADIRLRQGEIATVTLTCAADPDSDQLTTARFGLWLLDPPPPAQPKPPLDLDAMCAAARERLATATACSAIDALEGYRAESHAINVRMSTAMRDYRKAAAKAILRPAAHAAMRDLVRDLASTLNDIAKAGRINIGAMGGATSAAWAAQAALGGNGIGGNLTGKCRGGI